MILENETIIGTVCTLAAAAFSHLLTRRMYNSDVRKRNAEVEAEISGTIKQLLDMAQEEVTRQKEHRESCEAKVARLELELNELRHKL